MQILKSTRGQGIVVDAIARLAILKPEALNKSALNQVDGVYDDSGAIIYAELVNGKNALVAVVRGQDKSVEDARRATEDAQKVLDALLISLTTERYSRIIDAHEFRSKTLEAVGV